MNDGRIAVGYRCTWWDSIGKATVADSGLPVCPECGGALTEVPDENTWWSGCDKGFDAATEIVPGTPKPTLSAFRRYIEWCRGKCYPSIADAYNDFLSDKRNAVPESPIITDEDIKAIATAGKLPVGKVEFVVRLVELAYATRRA